MPDKTKAAFKAALYLLFSRFSAAGIFSCGLTAASRLLIRSFILIFLRCLSRWEIVRINLRRNIGFRCLCLLLRSFSRSSAAGIIVACFTGILSLCYTGSALISAAGIAAVVVTAAVSAVIVAAGIAIAAVVIAAAVSAVTVAAGIAIAAVIIAAVAVSGIVVIIAVVIVIVVVVVFAVLTADDDASVIIHTRT